MKTRSRLSQLAVTMARSDSAQVGSFLTGRSATKSSVCGLHTRQQCVESGERNRRTRRCLSGGIEKLLSLVACLERLDGLAGGYALLAAPSGVTSLAIVTPLLPDVRAVSRRFSLRAETSCAVLVLREGDDSRSSSCSGEAERRPSMRSCASLLVLGLGVDMLWCAARGGCGGEDSIARRKPGLDAA